MTKYNGDKDNLDAKLSEHNLKGLWSKGPKRQTFRTADGAILVWHDNGTLQIQGRGKSISLLEQMCADLEDQPSFNQEIFAVPEVNPNLFIVYGHDDTCREQLELILERLDLDYFVLGRTSGSGQTIIDALEGKLGNEGESNVGIVLLTPDDHGYADRNGAESIRPRARQNVIFEMGMLFSKLGRQKTIILVKGEIERPSDLDGIIYLPFKNHVKEVGHNLIERLEEAGFAVDPQKIRHAIR